MTSEWKGLDPLQRGLRAVAVIALLAMAFVVVLDPDKSDNGELLFLLFGSILVALGYPYVMKIPGSLGPRRPPPKDEQDDGQHSG